MAATRLIALHQNKGKSVGGSIKDRLDYAQNPDKTKEGEYVTSYECNPATAWAEFVLSRNAYQQKYSREYKGDIIAYQIRQSFKPGEISPEEANQVGYETAMRFTKGKHAFTVSTHIDKAHVHNHIIFNAVSLNGEEKFRDFYLSGKALAKLSDTVCLEHNLSIITPRSRKERQRYDHASGHRSGNARPFDFLIDIEQKVREGKGVGYERWAKHFNNKQAAEVLIFLQENNVCSYKDLEEKAEAAWDKFDAFRETLREQEKQLKELGELKKTIITYVRTRDVYAAYKKGGYSKRAGRKFYEDHRDEIIDHQEAKQTFDKLKKEGKPIPKIQEISAEYDRILNEKREAYRQYKEAKTEMQTWQIAKKNMEMLLDMKGKTKEKIIGRNTPEIVAKSHVSKRPERLGSHLEER